VGSLKRELVPGDRVEGKPAGLQHLVPDLHSAPRLSPLEDDDDDPRALGGWSRVNTHEWSHLHLEADFFFHLSCGRLLGRLVDLHVAGGEGPSAAAGLDGAAEEQQAAAALDDDPGHNLRVEVEDALAPVADESGTVFCLEEPFGEVTAAAGAKTGLTGAGIGAGH
jgi:hypothetical protein